jgi:hypothetical protein
VALALHAEEDRELALIALVVLVASRHHFSEVMQFDSALHDALLGCSHLESRSSSLLGLRA